MIPEKLIPERSVPFTTVTLPPLIVTLPDVLSVATRIPEAGTHNVVPPASVMLPKAMAPSPAASFFTMVNVPPSTVMDPLLAALSNPMESAPAPSFAIVPLNIRITAIEDERLFVTVKRATGEKSLIWNGRLELAEALFASSKCTLRSVAIPLAQVPENFLITNVSGR